jgi:small-conductance mechanosensitive channel
MEFFEIVFLGNPIRVWLVAFFTVLGTATVVQILRRLLLRRIKVLTGRTKTELDDTAIMLVEKTNGAVVWLLAIYFGLVVLQIPADAMQWVRSVAFAVVMVQVAIWGNALIQHTIVRETEEMVDEDAARATTLNAVSFVLRLLLYSILLLLALDNIPGVEVTALLTGLGIGGVAVALAVQNILGDLFASLSIALDKPFVIGDFIVVGDFKGTVQHIGLKTTRVRSLWGEELVFANSDLLNSRIRNYKLMEERRVSFSFGVAYETAPDKLRQIPQIARELIEKLAQTRFDRAHFAGFGNFSLNFEVVYYVLTPEYNVYMDIQQEINLGLLETLAELGVEFAYPTQKLYVAGTAESASRDRLSN